MEMEGVNILVLCPKMLSFSFISGSFHLDISSKFLSLLPLSWIMTPLLFLFQQIITIIGPSFFACSFLSLSLSFFL